MKNNNVRPRKLVTAACCMLAAISIYSAAISTSLAWYLIGSFVFLLYITCTRIRLQIWKHNRAIMRTQPYYEERQQLVLTIADLRYDKSVYRAHDMATGLPLVITCDENNIYGPSYRIEIEEREFARASPDGNGNIYAYEKHVYTLIPNRPAIQHHVTSGERDVNDRMIGRDSTSDDMVPYLVGTDVTRINNAIKSRLRLHAIPE